MAVAANRRSIMTLFSDSMNLHCHRVRIVLAEKSISVDIVDVDAWALPDEVMDFNPYGTVPTLVDRDLRLYESRIIMEYLDERFPHPPLLPVDPVSRATSRLYMYRVERDWYTLMDRILEGPEDEAATAHKELRESLIATSPVFAANPFFMNSEFSLMDCCVAPLLWRLPLLGLDDLLSRPNDALSDYAKRIFAWPAFVKSLTEAEREMVMENG